MRLLNLIPVFFKNKYFLSGSFFVIWILFFDRNDVFTQFERQSELNQLEKGKRYYAKEIEENRQIVDDLNSNPAAIEKYAREKYLMKRDDEDLFLIQNKEVE